MSTPAYTYTAHFPLTPILRKKKPTTRLKVTALSVKLAGGIEISEGLGRGLNASSEDDEFKAVARLSAPLPQSVSQYRLVTLAYVFQYCFVLLLFIIHI